MTVPNTPEGHEIIRATVAAMEEHRGRGVQIVQSTKTDKVTLIISLAIQSLLGLAAMIGLFIKLDARLVTLEVHRENDARDFREMQRDFKTIAIQVLRAQK